MLELAINQRSKQMDKMLITEQDLQGYVVAQLLKGGK